LLVDDDENCRNLLAMLLEDAGFSIVTAKSGNDARQFHDKYTIDLVITDQFMPDGDGWSVLEDWSAQNIPLILISAAPPERPKDLPETLHFASVQLKPIDTNTLLNVLGELLTVEWVTTKNKVDDKPTNLTERPPMELLTPLKAMIELGALTEIAEWVETFSLQYPEYASYATQIATANLMIDFKELRRMTT
jgi:DNA-binding NtrC family response regulator